MKTVASTSGFRRIFYPKISSLCGLYVSESALLPAKTADQSSRLEVRLTVFSKETVSQSQISKAVFLWFKKQGSEAMGSAAMMKPAPQLSCQMLKMGSSGRSGSTQGVYAWKVVEADD